MFLFDDFAKIEKKSELRVIYVSKNHVFLQL